jgi:YVTN family beta-propeller protein
MSPGRILIAGFASLVWQAQTVHARPFAYVTNEVTGAVSDVNTVQQAVSATIALSLPEVPTDVKMSPDGRRLYVASAWNISIVDPATGRIVATIQDGIETSTCIQVCTRSIALSADGAFLYVTTVNPAYYTPGHDTLTVIDTTTRQVLGTIPLQVRPNGLAVASNGLVYVTADALEVIDTKGLASIGTVPLDTPGGVVAVTPDARLVYVGTSDGYASSIEVLDTATDTISNRIRVPYAVGGLAVTPDGRFLYATSTAGTISVIDVATNQIVTTLKATRAECVAISPDGAFAYVCDRDAMRILVIDTATRSIAGSIAVAEFPRYLAVSPDGTRLYVADSDSSWDVHVLDTVQRREISRIQGGDQLPDVALSPDGQLAYVLADVINNGQFESAIRVLETSTNTEIGSIPLRGAGIDTTAAATRLALAPDGGTLYVNTSPIAVVDTSARSVAATLPVPGSYAAIAVSPDGKQLYAAANGSLYVVDARTLTVSLPIDLVALGLDGPPVDIALTPDGSFAYISTGPPFVPEFEEPRPGSLAIFEIATAAVVARFPGSPRKVAFRPDGTLAYVATDTNAVTVIDTAAQQIVASVDVGAAQGSIAVTPDGRFVYATDTARPTVSVIDVGTNQLSNTIYIGGWAGAIAIGPDPGRFCPGDCNADGVVRIDELLTGVAIVLGTQSPAACPFLDENRSGTVGIEMLIRAVNAALDDCSDVGAAGDSLNLPSSGVFRAS